MKESAFKQYVEEKQALINTRLMELVQHKECSYHILFDAACYALHSPGKRLRPLLTLTTLESFQKNALLGLDAACAIEMIHAYSLIHDDLPCMDDDDYRRGQPTLHKAFPEAIAVLAGDFLLTYAFQVIGQSAGISDVQKIALINLLAERSGANGMIGGQVIDIAATGNPGSLALLQEMHQKKTGALISCAIECGAIIAGADADALQKLKSFAYKLGLVFQIVDDILDVSESLAMKGKPVSSDMSKGKTTYVQLLGMERAKEDVENMYQEAIAILHGLPIDSARLQQIAAYSISRKL